MNFARQGPLNCWFAESTGCMLPNRAEERAISAYGIYLA